MGTLDRNGITLAYEDVGSGGPAAVLVHGWSCNRSAMAYQAQHLAEQRRTVSVDLRGHGESSAPNDDGYSVEQFADDVVWMCDQLDVGPAVFIGHSLGGSIVAQIVGAHPEAAVAGVLLDPAPFEPTPELQEAFGHVLDGLAHDVDATRSAFIASMFLPNHDRATAQAAQELVAQVSDHVARSAFAHLAAWDPSTALSAIECPILHLAAEPGFNSADVVQRLIPGSTYGKTVGAGHIHQLEVPDQVNPMIDSFLREYVN